MGNTRWVKSELEILKEYYGKLPLKELSVKLPSRTLDATKLKATRLGLTPRKQNLSIAKLLYSEKGKEILEELYIKKRLSQNKIAQELDCSQWLVHKTMRKNGIKARSFSETNRGRVPWNLRKVKASPALAYVLGVALGDGTLVTKDYIINLRTKDKDFADVYNQKLCAALGRSKLYPVYEVYQEGYGIEYNVRGFSKGIYEIVKSGKWRSYADVFLEDFLRGLFDSEGSVNFSVSEDKRLHKAIVFSNTNKEIVDFVAASLTKLGIPFSLCMQETKPTVMKDGHMLIPKKEYCYCLYIQRKLAIERFARLVGFSILRKSYKLSQLLEKLKGVRKSWAITTQPS
jgi:intein-encoded DNA endonuclease-like protein